MTAESTNRLSVQWRCLKCLALNETQPAAPGVGPWTCAKCGETEAAHTEALRGDGTIKSCPCCGCPDLYRQRDFNRKLGAGIVLAGMALAPFTMYTSIIACLLIDVAIYRFTPEVVCCYYCHAILRGYPGTEKVEPFELITSEKYIGAERERGW